MLGATRKHQMGGDVPQKKERKPINYAETRVQQELVKWLRGRPDWMVMRLENAKRRRPAEQVRDKSLGMLTGAPDLVLLYKKEVVFFEVKTETGSVSPAQKEVHWQLWARSQNVLVGYGLDDCKYAVSIFERNRT